MPKKQAKKTKNGEMKSPEDTRVPADKILLDFLQKEKLVLIADETTIVNNVIPGVVYTVDKRPRIRVYYSDQIEKKSGESGEKIDIVN
ncbi:hypothetical protein KKE60_04860 [Patescibacteria group bacterium]|nr:hypothetical protein [Patescibacteria group bacterium]